MSSSCWRWRRWAHPRVGGENRSTVDVCSCASGSSPRGRGKLNPAYFPGLKPRLIPAWAGKTTPQGLRPPARRAHPRVGGENASPSSSRNSSRGSSPRGRGKRPAPGSPSQMRGLIPAWAGKTSPLTTFTTGTWAHPRVGGENGNHLHGAGWIAGSSPRGRGKHRGGSLLWDDTGLIPAWAGKTSMWSRTGQAPGAHPRVGGENAPNRVPSSWYSGSSPRGRGKPGWWL